MRTAAAAAPLRVASYAMLLWALPALAAPLPSGLVRLTASDTLLAAWVVFTDKTGVGQGQRALSPAAIKRRQTARFPQASPQDQPVRPDYLAAVAALGGRQRAVFTWANAASFTLPGRALAAVASLPSVRAVVPVAAYRRPGVAPGFLLRKSLVAALDPHAAMYGEGYRQVAMMNVPLAHEYLQRYRGLAPGSGVVVGMFDTGFWLRHVCFVDVVRRGGVLADSNFAAPDSTPYYDHATHGAMTMALIGGWDPGRSVGVAWNASFVLARTEVDAGEHHVEEDYWAAALVWAEGLGVGVVNSSLGYRYGFTAPDTSYTYQDMDGRTTIVARATEGALARGVIIVSSMGNDGDSSVPTINSPADASEVVGVGAVDSDELIAAFSSRGPTSDGRTKPDCVAMGHQNTVLDDAVDRYRIASGTSFSAPLTAGVVALLRQAWPDSSAAWVRDRLYRSCRFAKHQDSLDNSYGRGIPDALLGVLREGELLVVAADSSGRRIPGVALRDSTGRTLAVTDTAGTALLRLPPTSRGLRLRAWADLRGEEGFVVDSLPAYRRLTFAALPSARFEVFPSVVRLAGSDPGLTIRLVDAANRERQSYAIAVRSLDGQLLWQTSGLTPAEQPLRVRYGCVNQSGRRLAPGTYVLVLACGGSTQLEKILVAP